MRDPYFVLGVQRTAGADEIKAAWRSKAKSVHPDHNQQDPAASSRFAEVGKAYEVLKDPERRRRYDRAVEAHQTIMQQRQSSREAAERARAAKANADLVMEELARANAQRAQAQANAQSGAAAEAAEDMIDRIFGAAPNGTVQGENSARPQPQSQSQSQPQSQSQQKSSTASKAAEQDETIARDDAAKTEPAAEPKPLPVQAVDLIAALVRRIRGGNGQPEKAPDHAVEASVSLEDLLKLNPVSIKLPEEREVRLILEAGMTTGHVARLKGQGLKVPGMQRGDLLVTLRIDTGNRFRIEDFDVHTILPISLEDAVLGSETEVETPDGMKPISIPPWSGSDRTVRMEGFGLFDADGLRGDLVVELRVMLWEKPDAKVTDLMRHMREGLYI